MCCVTQRANRVKEMGSAKMLCEKQIIQETLFKECPMQEDGRHERHTRLLALQAQVGNAA